MTIPSYLLIPLFFLLSFGCQQKPGEQQTPQAALRADMPQLKKIAIASKADVDRLIEQGLDVIVVEENYVVVRLDESGDAQIKALDLKAEPIQESDLVQRLAEIVVNSKSDVSELSNLGIDIWEVRGDTVLAQVFDKHLRQIKEKGYAVQIKENNVLDVVKKTSQK
ncbi:MAG: hypothetical protein ACE5G1_08720 [bacterium]